MAIDISKIPRHAVLNTLLPLLPGGVLVATMAARMPPMLLHDDVLLGLHHYERLVLALLASYLLGFVCVLVVDGLSGVLIIIGVLPLVGHFQTQKAPWNNTVWQKTARVYLPPGLAPADEPTSDSTVAIGVAATDGITPDNNSADKEPVREKDHSEWRYWYEALSIHAVVLRAEMKNNTTDYFMSTLTSLGVVGLIVLTLWIPARWQLWACCASMIVVGSVYKLSAIVSRVYMEPSVLTAVLLRLISRRTEPDSSGTSEGTEIQG